METQQMRRGLALAEKTFQWTLRMRAIARSAHSDRFILSQIQNAAVSAHLNLVEGNASIYPAEQLKFFSTARGSRILWIDSSPYDILARPTDLDLLAELILAPRKGGVYRV